MTQCSIEQFTRKGNRRTKAIRFARSMPSLMHPIHELGFEGVEPAATGRPRSMARSGRGSGVVDYNVQVAVDTEHHLIVTHEVTNAGNDTSHLAMVAKEAKAVLRTDE